MFVPVSANRPQRMLHGCTHSGIIDNNSNEHRDIIR
jgi:hypothetical protein